MGMYNSGDTFRDKPDRILNDIECVKIYINGILVFNKVSCNKNK